MSRPKFYPEAAIADLVVYAERELSLAKLDAIYAQNQLMSLFELPEPGPKSIHTDSLSLQEDILDPLVKYAVRNRLCKPEDQLIFETKVMGLVTPSPALVGITFDDLAANRGIEAATEYLKRISVNSNYIREADIKKNIRWTAPGPMGDLTVTINLAKPEKDNKQVAQERAMPKAKYPKCMLCPENMGFHGTLTHPARQTLRYIPIPLAGEDWYCQFSPYVYYDDHCIALSEEHRPMAVTKKTFTRLLDFVELFPHYFMGSNADLPIVGGSILAHDHFQGGKKVLPMFSRPDRRRVMFPGYGDDVKVTVLDWYNSVIKIASENRDAVEALASKLLDSWRKYSDASVNIVAETDAPHNTVTPIAEFSETDGFSIYLILRNNRTSKELPDGIFHPTPEMHNIKKEGIGLIEAMGLFILPGRLSAETQAIMRILTGEIPLNFAEISVPEHPLSKHLCLIAQLTNDFGVKIAPELAEKAVVDYINTTCLKILECTAVFKNTEEGQAAFDRFFIANGAFVR